MYKYSAQFLVETNKRLFIIIINLLTKKGKSSQFSVFELAVAKSFFIKVFT